MIPKYRRDCLPGDIPAWEAVREERLAVLINWWSLPLWAYYRFINKGVLP